MRFKLRFKNQDYWHCPTALLLFFSLCECSAHETWHSYRRHLLLHNNRLSLRELWLSPFSIRRCYVTKVCIEKNINRHFSLNFAKFCNKHNWPQCLVVFFIVILRFSAILNLLSDLSLCEFPLVRRVKAPYSHLFFNGHLYKTDTSIRRTPGAGPGRFSVILL